MYRLLLVTLFLLQSLFSDEPSPQNTALPQEEPGLSLVEYVNSSIPRIHDTVSVISGAWIESDSAMIDSNLVDPYQLGYGYASSSLETGALAHGWEFFHPSEVHISTSYDSCDRLISKEAGGGSLLFTSKSVTSKSFEPHLHNTGFTHISSISCPLRANPHSTKNKVVFK